MDTKQAVPSPLVADVGRGVILWVQDGVGWVLKDGAWSPAETEDVSNVGGRVLTRAEVMALEEEHGAPGWKDCEQCMGSGSCDYEEGYTASSTACSPRQWTGVCDNCGGSGRVEVFQ